MYGTWAEEKAMAQFRGQDLPQSGLRSAAGSSCRISHVGCCVKVFSGWVDKTGLVDTVLVAGSYEVAP